MFGSTFSYIFADTTFSTFVIDDKCEQEELPRISRGDHEARRSHDQRFRERKGTDLSARSRGTVVMQEQAQGVVEVGQREW